VKSTVPLSRLILRHVPASSEFSVDCFLTLNNKN
jgi:hypothetical protein